MNDLLARRPLLLALFCVLSLWVLPAGAVAFGEEAAAPAGGTAEAAAVEAAAVEEVAQTPVAAAPADAATKITQALAALKDSPDSPVWLAARDLAALGEGAKDALEAALEGADASGRVALGYALMSTGWQREGSQALELVVTDKAAPLARRVEAAAALGQDGGEYVKARLRAVMREEGLPDLLQVELAKSLWKLSYDSSASQSLRDMADNAKAYEARIEAALALGRFGRYDEAREKLREIAALPGASGDEARALLVLDSRNQKNIGRDQFTTELLGEVVDKIRSHFAYDENDPNAKKQLESKSMASAAARALARSLDEFNDYLDEDDYQEMLNGMHGDYGGIGAYVGMRDELFTILTPMWGKPAEKAGLKAMDIITKIDGDDITRLALPDIIKKLKGKPGTPVKVTVVRRGWDEPREFSIMRDLITMPMIFAQKLPGDIGYIRLTGFQEDPNRRISTSSELKQALLDFQKGDGIKGLVLDLRNNPGGLLSEAVNVCENFIDRNKLIVYSKGKVSPRRNYTSRILGKPVFNGPMVVLINGGSASASEIVSGALRDHKRATLVGGKTFGKGSVQMLLPVDTTDGNTRLKLTIAKYYLPSGESIHGRDKGIKPHVEIEEQALSKPARDLRIKDIENRDIALWLEQNFDANKDAFMSLLEYDNNDPKAYPKFDELFALLTKKYPDFGLTEDIVRQELRNNLFAFLRESRGIEGYPVDLSASEVMQRGLVVLGEKIGGLPDVAVYKSFRDKWKADDAGGKLAARDETAPAAEAVK